ncbi:hypothetical protein ACHQM5_027105 [Ranunculus cassubicifolius]
MASKTYVLKFKLFFLTFISLSISLHVLTAIFQLTAPQIINISLMSDLFERGVSSGPSVYKFFEKEFKNKKSMIALVNMNTKDEEEWENLGVAKKVELERCSKELQWEDFMREWINEERWPLPKCPELPMPNFKEYDDFNMVVSRMPCGNGTQSEGIRDVFRLQVNLIVANLVVASRRRPVYAVFLGSCGPMWEIFRCDDLLWQHGEVWVYKPDLRRLKQKVQMPVGTCLLSLPYVKQGDGEIKYLFSNLGSTIRHPRVAYATVLHSSEDYVCGAIALARSLLQTNTTKDLILLADTSISTKSRQALNEAGWKIKHINRIRSPHAEKDSYNEWNYSKLRLWQLTEYDKIIFIDSDLIVIKNIDDFFLSPQLSASSNAKVLFNSGVMLIEPSICTFKILMQKRHTLFSYNGGDQGFLNEAFTWWHRWPKKLNFLKMFDENDTQHELPDSVYAIHYLGLKPWMCYRDYDCNWDSVEQQAYASDMIHKRWWGVYDSMPRKLQRFCAMSRSMDFRIKEQRSLAKSVRLEDGHWNIRIKDPRKHHLV